MKRGNLIKKLIGIAKILIACAGFSIVAFFVFDYFNPVDTSLLRKISRTITASDGTWLYTQINAEHKWRFPVDIAKLDTRYTSMLITIEDHRFYAHHGVDPLAIIRALSQLFVHQKIISGGSTITMQLARLLEPKSRTIWAKIVQIIRAFQLEWHYSKEEILAAYLTLTPYGGNVEGVVAASMYYFGKLPSTLSASESALLVSLPQSPERNRPDRHPENATKVRNKILKIAQEKELISAYEYAQSIKQPPSQKIQQFPRYAPHLSQKILSNQALLSQTEVSTTLDTALQKQLESWALGKATLLDKDTTLAVMVIRNSDAAVQAYLGSHDMFSKRVSGHVDMIHAVRSPGSALKPFIYAFAFEEHFIHPNTLILDQETRFGEYLPHNFTYEYTGEVSVAYALQHSLNIPAIKILNRIGVESFLERISRHTGALKIPKNRASLPIALGGVGITMMQLSQLYVGLANVGKTRRVHYLKIPNSTEFLPPLCDPKAAKMTTAILRDLPPPDGFINTNEKIAYKTGTSYGYRDAWTIAYSKDYTVILWTGKPNNATQLKLTGGNTSAPLAFEVFSLLETLVQEDNWQWSVHYLGNEVPIGLANFDKKEHDQAVNRLSIIYPQDNARFRSAGCEKSYVEIKVENGLKPYNWYIDGEPIDMNTTSTILPFDFGAHTINIIDAQGTTITRNIWVDRPEC